MSRAARVVLDTSSFLQWLFRVVREPNGGPVLTEAGESVCVAFVSVGEAWATALELDMSATRQADFRSGIERFRVLPVDGDLAFQWAQTGATARTLGHNLATSTSEDQWVAATALSIDARLITANPELFEGFPRLRVEAFSPPS
jgi:predicted nucleic acid-binding protein